MMTDFSLVKMDFVLWCTALSHSKVQAQHLVMPRYRHTHISHGAALPYEPSFTRVITVLLDATLGGTFMSPYYDIPYHNSSLRCMYVCRVTFPYDDRFFPCRNGLHLMVHST